MILIFPGISNDNFDCSIGSNFPGNCLLNEYEFNILTSKTSIASRFNDANKNNEIKILILFMFDNCS